MKITGVVLERTGGPLTVSELELAPPGPEEVLVRLRASGVCHSDYNAVDGTSETVCPAVLGHEGAGVVEEIGAGVTRVAVGDHVALSWTSSPSARAFPSPTTCRSTSPRWWAAPCRRASAQRGARPGW